ncbi:outer membrane protein assembly factor BamD [Acinetobacter sp. HY1485]|uniref:outer membrane protein assembly factor BamD n=1 Tax=Acinetobacter sp. HY1485 TaxID=2970918 RepID=UPI0022B996C8|nr:outer membrane protein assembly factor BamD [Acinetobacter sp. HY1485]
MSLPRYKVTMLALSLGIASTIVGCSSNPSKKDIDLGPKASEQTYYDSAQQALTKGQYVEATKNLQAIDTYYPTGPHAEQAQLDLIYVKFQQKDYPAVLAATDRFIRLNPESPDLEYAYYAKGVANMEQNYDGIIRYTSLKQSHRDVNYLKIAYQDFVDFIKRYPSSQYAVDAAQRMKFIGQELAEHEMEAARFNVERKAWVAAIERSQWVVEHYPATPQIPEALATIVYGYEQLGDADTAKQYIDVLKLNYPNLVKANGTVDLDAARHKGTWVNRATLGIFGRSNVVHDSQERSLTNRVSFGLLDKQNQAQPVVQEEKPKRSLTNRVSFGLLDKQDQAQPVVQEEKPKRSWTNRLSFGLMDKPKNQ